MNPPAKLSDVLDALQMEATDHVVRFDRRTGCLVMVERGVLSAVEESEGDSLSLPDWQKSELEIARAMVEDSGERFIAPPDKFEFHEYRQMERFIGTVEDEAASEQLSRAIRGNGAFRCFKDTAARLNLLEDWYAYLDAAMKEFALKWAQANNVTMQDDTSNRRRRG